MPVPVGFLFGVDRFGASAGVLKFEGAVGTEAARENTEMVGCSLRPGAGLRLYFAGQSARADYRSQQEDRRHEDGEPEEAREGSRERFRGKHSHFSQAAPSCIASPGR